MCGIFAYLGPKNTAGDIVLEGLKSLEYRGYDSWGVIVKQENSTLFIKKQVGKIGEAKLPPIKASMAIGHTRWATHGGVTENNAHPHVDCLKKIVVVHNGIFENYEVLKKELQAKGHTFVSETDTEVFSHLIEERLSTSKDVTQTILAIFKEARGLNALIIFVPSENKFYAIKNGSPLVFGVNKKTGEYFLASDYAGILPHTKDVYFMEDNELLTIGTSEYKLISLEGTPKTFTFLRLDYKTESLTLGSYPHYMIKEINEQPKILTNIVKTQKQHIEHIASKIKEAYGTYLIGCGTAYYACLAGTYLFSKIAKRHVNASSGSEFAYLEDFIKDTSLILALSQSGETIDLIAPLKKAKEKGAKIIAITNVLGSTLYRMADERMLLQAGPEKCVLATKSFTAKIAILLLLSSALNGGYEKGANHLTTAISEIEKLIKMEQLKKIAAHLTEKQHVYILGRGSSYATALESALKIKEVSYIHAEGFAGGELKHGVIALIEKGTPVIIYNPEDETYEDTQSSAHEVKARGAYVIGISSKNSAAFDEFIHVENCGEATIIPNVVVAQLLGYYLALAKGLDPDKPRNLAKSVTVK